ncbi:GNAT family N-acetyltransferase [Evansella tamaricis]|uniref:GNAT family N-acetyltransferase n=1 Tax=Evansella tamaricis TaxID=2069301 RepID=A0ABS6JA99_9BACI|nr:GNAT family N-acetyltransferase [Evansella tamaricis]MBU9710601.1 GNAT family N-acetyltransferase [Evansella tamaricis]
MKIYKATNKDLDGVAVLFNLYRKFYDQPSDLERARQFISERFHKDDSVIFVAVDEAYLGFVQLYPSFSSIAMKRSWILNDLYVQENARGKGIGQQLLDCAVKLAKETNASSISLQTEPTNRDAQRLYEKNGFELDNVFFNYMLSMTDTSKQVEME